MESKWKRIGWGAVVLVFASGMAAEKTGVPFPEGYRSWQHVKSVVPGPEQKSSAVDGGKIFQFYANEEAVDGYRTGRFPNGSVIVRETMRTTDGERVALDVMRKEDGLYKQTSGWGFETFAGDKNAQLTETDRTQCYVCHSKQKDHDLIFTTLNSADGQRTPYPEGYRHWTFLHSSMVSATFDAFGKKPCEKPCIAGIFHFYANGKAMDGLRTGSYPDGAIIAEEMLEWLSTSKGTKEGQRRVVGVMVKDSQLYSSTGGWGYGSFDDGSRTDMLDGNQREACYQCHVARKDQGYVFTEYRER